MNRDARRRSERIGKRRTKPPIPRMKSRLHGSHASEARALLIDQATSAGRLRPEEIRPALVRLLHAKKAAA